MSTSFDEMPIEDRLRAHYADRAAAVTLPGPEVDTAVHQAQLGARGPADRSWYRAHRPAVLAAAAVVAVLAAVTGAIVVAGDGGRDGTVTESPDPTEPRPEPPPTTVPPAPGTSAVPDTSTTSTPPPPRGDAPAGPIVSRSLVIGAWSGSGWVSFDPAMTLPDREEYQLMRLDDPLVTVRGDAATIPCGVAPDEIPTVELAGDVGEPADPLVAPVAVAGVTDVQPRPVEVLDPASPAYGEAAREGLAGTVDDPDPEVTQVVRADLDGDGTDEVLIAAERRSDPETLFAAPGDYQALLLRQLVGGSVRTTQVAISLAPEGTDVTPVIDFLRFAAVADLNGDGTMEVVVDSTYYEGYAVAVYEAAASGLTKVLENGCGV
jgi:hypothetical protein